MSLTPVPKILKHLGFAAVCWGAGQLIGSYLFQKYEPMDTYDPAKDDSLTQVKKALKSERIGQFDQLYIDNIRRCNIDKMFVYDFLSRYFRYQQGYITRWFNKEEKTHFRALVRSDGKINISLDDGYLAMEERRDAAVGDMVRALLLAGADVQAKDAKRGE